MAQKQMGFEPKLTSISIIACTASHFKANCSQVVTVLVGFNTNVPHSAIQVSKIVIFYANSKKVQTTKEYVKPLKSAKKGLYSHLAKKQKRPTGLAGPLQSLYHNLGNDAAND